MRTRLFNSEVYFLSSVSPAMEGIFLARRPVSLSLSLDDDDDGDKFSPDRADPAAGEMCQDRLFAGCLKTAAGAYYIGIRLAIGPHTPLLSYTTRY